MRDQVFISDRCIAPSQTLNDNSYTIKKTERKLAPGKRLESGVQA